MDLDWLYYLSVKILGMSEEEFMHSTIRKIFALAEVHRKVNTPKNQPEQPTNGKFMSKSIGEKRTYRKVVNAVE